MTIRSYQYHVQVLVTPSSSTTHVRNVSESLSLSEIAESGAVGASVEDDLGLGETVIYLVLPGGLLNVSEDLGLTELAVSVFHPYVEEDLGLTESVVGEVQQLNQGVTEPLNLNERATYGFKVRNLTVSEDLSLSESIGMDFDGNVSESLGLTEIASFTDVVDDLGLTELATWGYGIDVAEEVNFEETVQLNKDLNPKHTDQLGLDEAASYYTESRCGRFQFQAFHGTGGTAPATKKLNYTSEFVMQSLDDGTVVRMRSPETDDRRRLAFNRVSRSFFDGTADIYSDPNWIVEETQIYTLVATKRDTLDNIQNFLLSNLGREVLIKDWKGVTWIVIITNPGELYTEDGEGYWTIDFEVEGEAIDGEYVLDRLVSSEVLSRAGSIWNRSSSDTTDLIESKGYERDLLVEESVTLSDTAAYVVEVP